MYNQVGGILVDSNCVVKDGRRYKLPNGKANNVSIINGEVFIDGYQLKHGVWKRTLRAIWHWVF